MNIILDYDGTVHDCAKIYVPAFRIGYKYLTDKGLAPIREFTSEDICSYLGLTVLDMWEKFMPELAKEEQEKCGKIISIQMSQMVSEGKSALFEGTEQTLAALKAMGHRLIFLSNCFHSYMDMHRKVHGLDRFYTDYYCTEDYGFKPKPEIFKSIREKYDGEFIVVGDRYLDLEIADIYSLKSIGCLYGYCNKGELDRATITINDISELPEAVERLQSL